MNSSSCFQALEVEERKEGAGLIDKRVAEVVSHGHSAGGRAVSSQEGGEVIQGG